MYLVAEENGASPLADTPVLGLLNDFAYPGHAGGDCAERFEVLVAEAGDYVGERSFAGSRRIPWLLLKISHQNNGLSYFFHRAAGIHALSMYHAVSRVLGKAVHFH